MNRQTQAAAIRECAEPVSGRGSKRHCLTLFSWQGACGALPFFLKKMKLLAAQF